MTKMYDFFKSPQNWIFIGSLITLAGAAIAGFATYKAGQQSEKESKILLDRATGGDSYCIVDVIQYGNYIDRRPTFKVFLKGTVPLKNVVVKVYNYAKAELEMEATKIIDPSSSILMQIIEDNTHYYQYRHNKQ